MFGEFVRTEMVRKFWCSLVFIALGCSKWPPVTDWLQACLNKRVQLGLLALPWPVACLLNVCVCLLFALVMICVLSDNVACVAVCSSLWLISSVLH